MGEEESMFSAVKVFSETKARERADLGAKITSWIKAEKPEIVDKVVRQSSDNAFHCLSFVFFYNPKK